MMPERQLEARMGLDGIGVVEVGARGGSVQDIAAFQGRIVHVLVEPDPPEAERLRLASADGEKYLVIPTALGNFDGEIDLHVTVNPYCTSALKVNHEFLRQYGIDREFQPKETVRIPCSRYDTLFRKGGLPVPHAIKIDVQGFEYQVLQGFGAHLHECLALEVETHFYPIYQDQRLFGDLVRFLQSYDFSLRCIRNTRSPLLRGDYHFEGDLVEVEAAFTKNRRWLGTQNEATKGNFELACKILDIDAY